MRPTVLPVAPCLFALLITGWLSACGGGGAGTAAPPGSPPPGPGAAPTVTSPDATSIGATGATLTGTVTPNGLPTECWFEYGTDPTLQACDNTARQTVSPAAATQPVTETVAGLAVETLYYHRLCASNSLGTARSPVVAFTTRACVHCHGGDDGTRPAVNGAPVVTRYWKTGGHGRPFASRGTRGPIGCQDCHDVGHLSSADHKTDGTAGAAPGNVNTLTWPGKSANANNAPNANTSHLAPSYFPSSPAYRRDFARAFDLKCGAPAAGCHRYRPHNNHPQVPDNSVNPADYVMLFGDGGSVPDPKVYSWYPESPDYAADFYKSPGVWEIGDLTTNASGVGPDNGVRYGTCVTCHDPHGSAVTDQKVGGGNAMLRGNWMTDPGQFCNKACHRSP